MMIDQDPIFTAFAAQRQLARGSLREVALAVAKAPQDACILVFDDQTGRVVDLDLRGSLDEVAARYEKVEPPKPRGRPKLGVTAREVTLLPRHWDWLAQQPGGASVTLRKLVEAARKSSDGEARRAQEAAWRFISVLAADAPGLEEAGRALFAADRARFEAHSAAWPQDVRDHALNLARPVWS